MSKITLHSYIRKKKTTSPQVYVLVAVNAILLGMETISGEHCFISTLEKQMSAQDAVTVCKAMKESLTDDDMSEYDCGLKLFRMSYEREKSSNL